MCAPAGEKGMTQYVDRQTNNTKVVENIVLEEIASCAS
jgi:hypothetical protein